MNVETGNCVDAIVSECARMLITGNMPVSSIEFGLYILRVDMDTVEAAVAEKAKYGERTRHRPLVDRTANTDCPPVRESQQCEPAC